MFILPKVKEEKVADEEELAEGEMAGFRRCASRKGSIRDKKEDSTKKEG